MFLRGWQGQLMTEFLGLIPTISKLYPWELLLKIFILFGQQLWADISRGIVSRQKSGRFEIKIGMPILIYPNIWDGSGSLSSNFRDKNWGKLRFSLTFPDVFWLIFSNFETKSWEKSRTIPTLPDFGSGWQSQFISPMAVSMSGFYLLSAVPSSKSLAASTLPFQTNSKTTELLFSQNLLIFGHFSFEP